MKTHLIWLAVLIAASAFSRWDARLAVRREIVEGYFRSAAALAKSGDYVSAGYALHKGREAFLQTFGYWIP